MLFWCKKCTYAYFQAQDLRRGHKVIQVPAKPKEMVPCASCPLCEDLFIKAHCGCGVTARDWTKQENETTKKPHPITRSGDFLNWKNSRSWGNIQGNQGNSHNHHHFLLTTIGESLCVSFFFVAVLFSSYWVSWIIFLR